MIQLLCTTLLFAVLSSAGAAGVPLSFIERHCVDCHDGATTEGDFRADLLGKNLADAASWKAWSRVLARVQSGEMPPPKKKERPAEKETLAALTDLKNAFHADALARHGEAGRVRVRRLNRLEYENTVRDLLGIDTALQNLLPEDDLRDGFSNQSGALSISPVHIQQYMAAADRALDAATVRQVRPETKTHRFAFNHEAEKFIDASKGRPFFLNLWCYGVHGPWGHKQEYTAEFAQTTDPRGPQGNPIMASMLRSVDECFGRILAKLDALGLAENTIVIFTSDNGGNVHSNSGEDAKAQKRKADDPMLSDWRKWAGDKPPTDNTPLRDGKGRLYEGGTRVPLMVRWPGKIAPATTSDAVVGCYDIYPTILDLAGLPTPPQQKIDGVSFAPVLRGTGTLQRDAYFIWFPHLVPGVSVRQGYWKLIRRFTERPGDYEGVHELFNLKEDLGESKNLAAQMPEKVKALNALIDDFVRDSGALYPKPNPAYKPRAAKPQPAWAKPGADPAAGLVPKFCKLIVADGAARVEADGRTPFLGTAQIKAAGPFTLRLRARSATGGPGKVQWTTKDQTEFPKTGQTVEFTLPADDWQDVTVDIPVAGDLRLLRLYLPADKSPVEINSIQYTSKTGTLKAWNFTSK